MIIGVAIVAYAAGAVLSSTTTTVASTTTTQFDVTTYTSSTVSSFTVESYIVQTTTAYETVTQRGSDSVLISGTVSTKTPGTIAKIVQFTSASTNSTLNAEVQEGSYSIQIPNRDSYNVYISFDTVTGNIGSGRCLSGGIVLFSLNDSMIANWSC